MAEILLYRVSRVHLARISKLASSELGSPEQFKPEPSKDELTMWWPNTGPGDERSLLINPSAGHVYAEGLDEKTALGRCLFGLQVLYSADNPRLDF